MESLEEMDLNSGLLSGGDVPPPPPTPAAAAAPATAPAPSTVAAIGTRRECAGVKALRARTHNSSN